MDETSKEAPKKRQGVEDRSGFGLLGLTAGLVGGFVVSYYALVPALPNDGTTNALTAMTVVTMVVMIVASGLGYYFTRRLGSSKNGNPA